MDTQKIQVIRQAEEQAKNLVSEAESTANKLVREAQSKAEEMLNDAKKTARDQETQLLNEYQKNGESKAGNITSELDRELSQINNSVEKKEAEAIAYLKTEMKVAYGDK